ncbi:MAG: diguanylate cyclase, partial [Polyangiaceae bacterium]
VKRLILVDDSSSVRALLRQRLTDAGFDVEEFPDGEKAAARAFEAPPDVVVTDLQMPGMSGVQLCRLLHAEPMTKRVPVVLLTAAGDRRSRFWAGSAGAVAYVSKTAPEDLVDAIQRAVAAHHVAPPAAPVARSRMTVLERLSQLLDHALFDAVIAGEVRALGRAGNVTELFAELIALSGEVMAYRWLAFIPKASAGSSIFLHTGGAERERNTLEARTAFGARPETSVEAIVDDRPTWMANAAPASVFPIEFGGVNLGSIAIAFAARTAIAADLELAKLIADNLGGPLRIAALIEDARRLAASDALTGLMNRRAFVDAMERERSRAVRHALPFSFVMIDVDHFKSVNDTFGHAAGDLVLQTVARVLNAIARRSDIVGRWGGEEFVVALPQTSEAGARVAGERLRRAISDASCKLPGGGTIQITASLGIASTDTIWDSEAIVARADAAMYQAKSRGRNRVEIAPMPPHSTRPPPAK